MKIVLAGKKDRAVACLKALEATNHEVVAVVTPVNDKSGNNTGSVTEYATTHGIRVFAPENPNAPEFVAQMKELDLDAIVLASYNPIIRKALIETPKWGMINLHGGKLPEYRGSSVMNWMMLRGEKEAGITIIRVDEGIDTGNILAQERWMIKPEDTIKELIEHSLELFPQMLVQVLDEIDAGILKEIEQNSNEGAYYHSRKPMDGRIDWARMSDVEVHNLVRSLVEPLPGAFFFHEGKKVLLWETELLEEEVRGVPGRIARTTRDGGAIVICGNRGLLLRTVQEEGGENLNAKKLLSYGDQME